MGRPKKVVEVSEDEQDTNLSDEVVENGLVEDEKPSKKGDSYSIVAKFKSKDTDGNTIIQSFESTGSSVEELLANLEFPKGTNCLVNVDVEKNGKKLFKALAPHKARAILADKNAFDFNAVFRGL